MPRPPPCTGACSVSASSTSKRMPSSSRATSPASTSGFSAATSSFATSATAAASPAGGLASASFGMRSARAVAHRFFLQRRVDDEHHGAARLGHRHAVGAHGRFREVLQRRRRVVPLQHVAHHRGRVRHRVRPPVEQRPPVLAARDVRAQEIRGRAPRERAEDAHRRVLQARRRERDDRHRLARHREVAVRDVDGRLLVRAREPLGRRVAAVIDERLVQAAEARRGIRDDVLELERLQHVDHEIGARVLDGQRVSRRRRAGPSPRPAFARLAPATAAQPRARRRRRLGGHGNRGSRERRGRGAAQELAAVHA